ncbi:MAG: Crp/Fnr family transcriptional regulator [Oscillospiraceae bacterium]|nr:Crp/Fnr family transcriptional regulator [Oscillospiraceae bacterium]
MSLAEYFPVFDKLTEEDRAELLRTSVMRTAPKGTLLNGGGTCMGLLVVRSGQLRAFITSEEGREVTLYRLFDHDICLFSASCVMNSVRFSISIAVEKDAQFWVIPPNVYREMMEHSAVLANYTNELMASRFSEIMWLIEQIMWKSIDKRLAAFLLEESAIEGTDTLKTTHEIIASHLGTAREVVTRMLKYFQTEEMVALTRGTITLTDRKKLEALGEA